MKIKLVEEFKPMTLEIVIESKEEYDYINEQLVLARDALKRQYGFEKVRKSLVVRLIGAMVFRRVK